MFPINYFGPVSAPQITGSLAVPVNPSGGVMVGDFTITQGDSYLNADGRAISFAAIQGTSAWPSDLTGWTIALTATDTVSFVPGGNTSITAAGSILIASGPKQAFYVELPSSTSSIMHTGLRRHAFSIVASKGADVATLVSGYITVK